MDIDLKTMFAALTPIGVLIALAYNAPNAHKRIVSPILSKVLQNFVGLLLGVYGMGLYTVATLAPYFDPAKQKDVEQVRLGLAIAPLIVAGLFVLVFLLSLGLDKLAEISVELAEDKKSHN